MAAAVPILGKFAKFAKPLEIAKRLQKKLGDFVAGKLLPKRKPDVGEALNKAPEKQSKRSRKNQIDQDHARLSRLDKAAPPHVDVGRPPKGIPAKPALRSLDRNQARDWYKWKLEGLGARVSRLDKNFALIDRAKLAHKWRNETRTATRRTMKSRVGNVFLDLTQPNLSFEKFLENVRKEGLKSPNKRLLTRAEAYERIIQSAMRSNPRVDRLFGSGRTKRGGK